MTDPLIGATTAVFVIKLSVALTEPVDVAWSTKDGTAKAGIDYQAANGVVTFLPGDTEKQIQVTVYGQPTTGPNKTFYIQLTPPTNAILGNSLVDCIITVVDEDGTAITTVVVAQGKQGLKGDPGLSAYEQAVLMGYEGTVEQWMDSIADASQAATRAEEAIAEVEANAAKAEAAAAAAAFSGRIYPTPSAGVDPVTGVPNGAYFNVRSTDDDNFIDEYQNIGGVPTPSGKSYPSASAIANIQHNNLKDRDVAGAHAASAILDESGRSQQQLNDDYVNFKSFGAIGDNTLHKVQEWTVLGSKIYYPNLAAIQVDYPHVESLDDSIDWAAIQKALNTGRDVVGPSAYYRINKSLYIKQTRQKFKELGVIWMDASIAKPVLYLGAKDTNGTKSDEQVWFAEISGTSFYGHNNRSEGSAGLSLVSCSQCKLFLDIRGFHAGIRVDGVCILNTFFQPILLQNTYGIYDPLGNPTTSDIQGSVFFGGRIEQNEKEGVYLASPNIKFIGSAIEGNGKFNGSDGTTPEVTILAGPTSGAVTFTDCYMESLDGKPALGTIVIAPMASRSVKVMSGDYFGGVTNKNNIVMVEISAPASAEVSVTIIGASLSDYKNYGRGIIAGNSQFNAIGCVTKEPLVLWFNVLDGGTSGRPLIFQSDRNYYYSNQDHRIRQITASGPISTTDSVTATGLITGDYLSGKNSVLGLNLYNNKFTKRNRTPAAVASSYTCIPISDIAGTIVYMFKIMAVQKLTNNTGRAFEANLLVAGNSGSPTILNSQVLWNTDVGLVPTFSIDATGVVVSNLSTSGLYDFEVTKFGRT